MFLQIVVTACGYGVAIEKGRQIAAAGNFDESEPAKTLGSVGFVK